MRAGEATTEDIVERITAAVLEQRFPLGAKLREESLCEIFGVSRTKVRQALNRLAQSKLIELRPRRGAFVTQPTPRDAREIFDARRVIEREIIARFAKTATSAQVAELFKHVDAERHAIESADVPRRNRLLGYFHIHIAEWVGNTALTEILTDLVSRSSLMTLLFQSSKAASCSSDEHLALIKAIRRGDRALAVRLMDEHLDHVEHAATMLEGKRAEFDLRAALTVRRARSE